MSRLNTFQKYEPTHPLDRVRHRQGNRWQLSALLRARRDLRQAIDNGVAALDLVNQHIVGMRRRLVQDEEEAGQ